MKKKNKELKIKYIDINSNISNNLDDNRVKKMMDDHLAKLDSKFGKEGWHCDDLWYNKTLPQCLQEWLDVKRAPAIDQIGKEVKDLFATYKEKRVKINMASRFGDLGISYNLEAKCGYDDRGIYIPELTDFSNTI